MYRAHVFIVLLTLNAYIVDYKYVFTCYDPGYNILEIYNILVQVRVTTNKTKRDIQYSKIGIRVALPVAERLKILGNIRKISNFGGDITWCLVSLQELRLCQ